MNWYKKEMAKNWFAIHRFGKTIKQMPIQKIAERCRKNVELKYRDLRDKCLQVSKELKNELIKNGYGSATVVQGVFRVDNPNPQAVKNLNPGINLSHDEMEEAKYWPIHYWVEVEGFMIDIAADQFRDELDAPFSSVFIKDLSYYNSPDTRHMVVQNDWI